MTRLVEALRARGLDAEISLAGRWAEFRGARCRVYIFEAARSGGYYTWCDAPDARTVEAYPDPDAAIAAGLRRAAAVGGRAGEGAASGRP